MKLANNYFSIIIPLYNKEKYIKRAINSILEQSYSNFELIIIDDGSTDQSFNKACEITDERINIIRQNNMGLSTTRNIGIQHSRHSLVAFLDADDYWESTFLQIINALINEFPRAGIYFTGYYLHYDKGTITKTLPNSEGKTTFIIKNYFKELLRNNWGLFPSGVVVRKKIFDHLGFFPVGVAAEDVYMWDRIALFYPIAYNNQILSNYSGDIPGQITKSDKAYLNKPGEVPDLITKSNKDNLFSATLDSLYNLIKEYPEFKKNYHLLKYMRRCLYSKITNALDLHNEKKSLYKCLDINHAPFLNPLLNTLFRHRLTYLLASLWIVFFRYTQSEKILKIIPKRIFLNLINRFSRNIFNHKPINVTFD